MASERGNQHSVSSSESEHEDADLHLSPFRECMVNVAWRLTVDNVRYMTFAASDHLPMKIQVRVGDSAGLLHSFENARLLQDDYIQFLLECLMAVCRTDVVAMVTEELGVEMLPLLSSSCSAQPFPVPRLLGVNCPRLSPYRVCMVEVALALRDDARLLVYAARDILKVYDLDAFKDSVDFLQAIENRHVSLRKRIICLFNCLRSVRRWDVIHKVAGTLNIASLLPSPPLPSGSSFGYTTVRLLMKKEQIKRAQHQYSLGRGMLSDPAQYRPIWNKRFALFFDWLVRSFDSKAQSLPAGFRDDANVAQVICESLEELSVCITKWSEVVISFYENPSPQAISTEMANCYESFNHFESILPKGWKSELRDKVRRSAWKWDAHQFKEEVETAHRYLCAFEDGLIGGEDNSNNPSFKKVLSIDFDMFELISYTFGYLQIFSSWISTVLDLVLSSSLVLGEEVEEVLCRLLRKHWRGLNRKWLAAIRGDLLDSVKDVVLTSEEHSGAAVNIQSPLESVVAVALIVLLRHTSVPVSSASIRSDLARFTEQRKDSTNTVRSRVIDEMHKVVDNELERVKETVTQKFIDRVYSEYEYADRRRNEHQLHKLIKTVLL